MSSRLRGPEPDPGAARDAAEFREQLKKLQVWAGLFSLHQMETAAERAGVSMPVSTANRALNADKLPTAEFVRRFVLACGGDLPWWRGARDALSDALSDARYSRDGPPPRSPLESSATCPYPGLAPFGPEHARYFFGRERDTGELIALMAERLAGGGPLIVVGPSGAGKSSLLGAGLADAVARGRLPGCNVPVLRMTPGAAPLRTLGETLAPFVSEDLAMSPADQPERIVEALTQPGANGPRAVLVVDQFEEVFTLGAGEEERHGFVTALSTVSAGLDGCVPLLVVIGVRADFYGRCTEHDELTAALRRGHLPLGAMCEAQLREAIERPASAEGLTLEPGLIDLLVRDLGGGPSGVPGYQAGALPLLAHALRATWQQRDGTTLTVGGYRLVGGISGAVSRTAERAYQELDDAGREVAQAMLPRLVRLGQDTGDARRRIRQDDLAAQADEPALVETVLGVLIQARLLTTDGTNIEIIHEALLDAWPRLREWIEADRAGLLVDEQVLAAAQAWDRDARHESDLYRGPRLAIAQDRRATARLEPPPVVVAFLDAALALEQAERDGTVARARRLRRRAAVLAVLLVLALGATGLAIVGQYDLRREAAAVTSRRLAADSTVLRGADTSSAAQLALVAHDLEPTPESAGAVLSGLLALQRYHRANDDAGGGVAGVAVSIDGGLLAAADGKDVVRLWRLDAQRRFTELPLIELPHPGPVRAVAFDPTGRFLATLAVDGLARLYPVADLADGTAEALFQFPALDGVLAFSPDGGLVAVGGRSNGVVLWDVRGPLPVRRGADRSQRSSLTSAAWNRSGSTLATASFDGTVQLWDVADPDRLRRAGSMDAGVGFVLDVEFRPDGRVLASGHADGSIRLWDVTDREQPSQLKALAGHSGRVAAVAFSADGRLATVGDDRTARLWDVRDAVEPSLLVHSLVGDIDALNAVTFLPDGVNLVTAGDSRTVRIWETDVDRARRAICANVTAPIPLDVWQRYLPELPYDPPCGDRFAIAPIAGPVPPGSVEIVAQHSRKCVAIREGSTTVGAPAYQVPCDGAPGTRWILRPAAGAAGIAGPYRLVNAASGQCLESSDRDRPVGGASRATQRPCAEVVGQAWQFEPIGPGENIMTGVLRNARHADCLDINGNTTADDAPVIRWQCGRSGNQIFEIPTTALSR